MSVQTIVDLTRCLFPGCVHQRTEGYLVCWLHRRVRVASTGSWVNDRHDHGGHG